MLEICRRIDATGKLDYFNVNAATVETYVGEAASVPNMSFALGLYAHLAASIRKVVDVPVIATGRIVDPVQADRIIAEGQADLCIMNRALIADPHLPNKAKAHRLDDIRQCMGYNEGCIDRIYTGRGVTCVQNPVIGREDRWAELGRCDVRKRVVVVGGGPAGLEAARVAAGRGHDVVLFEREAELGGQTLIARLAPSRQDFDGATRWSSQQCRKLGVDLRLRVEADADRVLAEQPDAVILATGARARRPALEGMDSARVVSGWDVLLGAQDLGEIVIVIDEEYGHQAPTIAEFLLDRGKQVDLVTSQETIGTFLGATTRPPLLTRLFGKGGQLFAHLEAAAIRDGKLVANNIWTGAAHEMGPYDAFVYAYGGVRYDPLSESLQRQGLAVEVIGDAFSPRSLQHAILEGHTYGRKV
jgi:hypothetical protein